MIEAIKSRYQPRTFKDFAGMVGAGGSVRLAASRFRPDIYRLEMDLRKLGEEARSRACRELLRSDNPLEVELAFTLLPPAEAVRELFFRFMAGTDLSWTGLRLLAQAPRLGKERLFAMLDTLNPAPLSQPEEVVLKAVADALVREDGEVRGVDGRQLNKRNIRKLLTGTFPEIGPAGRFTLVVSPHERSPRVNMLLGFRELLVKRVIADNLVTADELPALMRADRETDKMIVARHPAATAEQLNALARERSDWIAPAARDNAAARSISIIDAK